MVESTKIFVVESTSFLLIIGSLLFIGAALFAFIAVSAFNMNTDLPLWEFNQNVSIILLASFLVLGEGLQLWYIKKLMERKTNG